MTQTGRPRQFLPIDGMDSEIAHLFELHQRCTDLVDGVDPDARDEERAGHSVNKLLQHMIDAEAKWMAAVSTGSQPNFTSVAELEPFTRAQLQGLEPNSDFLGDRFSQLGQMLRHMQWHWSYHTAQISLIRKMLGSPYLWQ